MSYEFWRNKIVKTERFSKEEALGLYQSADLLCLGELADLRRRLLHPEPLVSYIIDRNINYTNVCISGCRFCAFYREEGKPDAYVLSKKELGKKIDETLSVDGVQILLQGGLHPKLPIEFYEDMLGFIKHNHPIHVHGFSPPEIVHFSNLSGLPVSEVLNRLIAAGLDSIPGGGAEILVDRVRRAVSPNKCTADEWLSVMEEAHLLGLKTTATMMFGHIETVEERIEHLIRLRNLQDRTGGFTAFIPWPFQPRNTQIEVDSVGGVEYLRMLAVSRVVLDNIPNLQASWVTQGPKVAQIAIKFGANDFGSTMIEENVVAATGVHYRLSEKEIRRIVADAGYTPARRNMAYEIL
ncbi:MAG: cyclic dehypoxanthinyl futalosine synthase [Pseudomonadota bacterium]